ncbi:MAG TPA: class I SAM-dependent methyltransferase [Acidimicrobiales bacterium]|nr:class I SAM-dependent methyltransferase [Acidimicrobiales bacterium]
MPATPAVTGGAGETAAARWRRLVEARLGEMERLRPGGGAIGAAFWKSRARWYHSRLPTEVAARDPFLRRLRRASGNQTTVIDVGAGTGRLALNLAPRVRSVTAVDPSPHMLAILRDEARRLGVANVQVVEGRWEEVEMESADIAFSSYVLPLGADAPGFVGKLSAAARRHAFLYLGAFSMDAVVDPLWRHFHGAPRQPGPSHLDAVAVLQELGLRPAVEVVEVANRTRFASVAEAAKEYRDYLYLPAGRGITRELEALLGSWLVPRSGALGPPLRYVPAAIISWRPAG